MILAMPLGAHMGSFDRLMMDGLPFLYSIPPDLIRWTLLLLTGALSIGPAAASLSAPAAGCAHGDTNMNTLVSLGTGAAFLYSAYATMLSAERPRSLL